ncbi:MAG: 30S ribosomal protein S20 [Alphaproteobacteria bacterium]|nr:30S ribosomal protein S20 [Alphaproteobacteria bacterium]
MANTPSARKRVRRNASRALINSARMSRLRTFIKKVEQAVAAGDRTAAQTALKDVQPELGRGVSKGLLKRNAAARKMSRLAARVKALK